MQLPELKQRLSIETVLQRYKLKPDKNHMLKCPFHGDKAPSLKIYDNTNTFYCFGCGATGDAIQFIELYEKVSKHESILKAKSLVNPLESITPQPMETIAVENPDMQSIVGDKTTLPRIAIMSKIAQKSRASLKRSAKAQEYLKARHLEPDKMEVGYIGEKFGKGWTEALQQSALKIGMLRISRQNEILPKFRYCLLFFTKNEKGQVIDVYGRSIIDNKEHRHFYLNGNHKGIYPHYPKPETRKLILTESLIDCETLLQQEELNRQYSFISLFGTNGLSDEIKEAIKELPELNEIILFFDGDEAGEKAIAKHTETLQQLKPGIQISKVETPQDEDVNSLLDSHDNDILQHLINERKTLESTYVLNQNFGGQRSPGAGELSGGVEPGEIPTDSVGMPEPTLLAGQLNTSNTQKLTYAENNLQFTIWGGIEKDNIHRLKINLLVQLKENDFRYYQDDVNLYSNGQLQRYIKGAAEELECSTTLLKATIRRLQNQLESYRLQQIEQQQKALKPKTYQLSKPEQKSAENFLKSKHLVKNTMQAISKGGLIGEQKNGLLLYFLYLSRLFEEPLHAIIFGKSGSGKTYLQTKISECLPEESVRTITSLTENTLYYSAKDFWKHKLLLIEDLEGVYNAFLPLREFMSKQSISKLTTDKDAKGNNVQKVLMVEGPICVSGATTKANIYEDNANRSFLLHVDESPGHAKEVMDYQRKQQAGLVNESEQQQHKQLLKNCQRLLRKVRVINPYATKLDIPECVFKKLRTNMHYLRLIEIITFYHQYQREIKTDSQGKPHIETTPQDIEWANYLIKDSLLRKSDELSGQVRDFFESLKSFADKKEEPKTIYAKEVREAFRMNPMTINRYLRELENRGYIQRNGGNRKTGFEYEIRAWDEYEKLKSGIDILDGILEKVKCNTSIT
ncbi:MAG TPA: DNA primase [Bacteroidales bacterium]|nr:DNA primase [Bacteroidales bacterium]